MAGATQEAARACLAAQWPPSSHLRSLAVPVPPLPPPHCKTEPRPCVAGREYPCGPPAPPAHRLAEGAPARPASNCDLHRLQHQVFESQRGGEGCSSAQGEHQQPSARRHRRRASRTASGSGGLNAVQAAVRERGEGTYPYRVSAQAGRHQRRTRSLRALRDAACPAGTASKGKWRPTHLLGLVCGGSASGATRARGGRGGVRRGASDGAGLLLLCKARRRG